MTETIETLTRRLLDAQEAERRRIARELHDEVGQALTAVKINLQAAGRTPGAEAIAPQLDESIKIIERTLQQVRNLSLDLRPSLLDDLGLVAALRWYVDRQGQRAGIATRFIAEPADPRLRAEIETACFRLVQEALTNVVRHAQAHSVTVELRQVGAGLRLRVRDDGHGFDVPAALARAARGESLGLLGMQERVALLDGQIVIRSTPGQGAEILVMLPVA
ncbi:MAG: sensor histidine kinase [Chloroflexi bacterium]|nr:sensor histidine kinase [Chloroflexota bacterium]